MTHYYYSEALTPEEKARELQENKWWNGQERIEANKTYKLIHDPTETWWYCTHFSRREIKALIREGSIEAGCRLKNTETGDLFEIKHVHIGHLNGLILAPVEMWEEGLTDERQTD